MVLQVYGTAYSGNVRRVLCVLAECGLFQSSTFEFVEINRDDLKKKPHIDRSPFGLMPYMVDSENGKIVFESRAICRYIASKVQSPLLINPPADFDQPDQVDRWTRFEEACSIESTIWDVPVFGLAKELKMKKDRFGQEPDENMVKHYRQLIDSRFGYLDRLLAEHKYLAGNEVTLADLFCLPYGERMDQGGLHCLTDGSYPNIARWWASLTSRSSWASANLLGG